MANDLGFEPTKRYEDYYFVSYSSEDINYVGSISRKLHDQNIPLWYDRGINYGENWEATISKKIIHCTAVILFLSPQVFKKKDSYVLQELQIAWDFKKPVYVLLLKEIISSIPEDTYHFWVKIKSHQGITAYKMSEETVLCELERALEQTPVSREIVSVQPNKKQTVGEPDKIASDDFENIIDEVFSDSVSMSSFTKNDKPETSESKNTVSGVSSAPASYSEQLNDIINNLEMDTSPGAVTAEDINAMLASKPKKQKTSPYKQDKKEYRGVGDGLDGIREDIYSVFNNRSEYLDSKLLTYAKKYYQRCTEVHGESDEITSSAYELMAYITYMDKLYRDAIPLLEKIYRKKTAQLGKFHQETIDVLFMLADANQNKDSIFPSFKYQKEFLKLAEEFIDEDSLNIDSDIIVSCRLCKPWNTYKHQILYSDDNPVFYKEFCDYKLLSSYVDERVLHYKPKKAYRNRQQYLNDSLAQSEHSQSDIAKHTKYQDLENRLYVSDLLYGPLSIVSKEELKQLGRRYFYETSYGKSLYYYRLYLERCLSRLEKDITGSLSEAKTAAKDTYERYQELDLKTCPQAQEALKKYEELKDY